jgi:hypothetical protein
VKRPPLWLALVALTVALAVPAAASARPYEALSAATCAKETKRLNSFKRGMKAAKRRFFRTHASKQARARFRKQQRSKLKRLQRARKRCLDNQPPGGGQPQPQPQPGPPGGDGGPGPAPPTAVSTITDVISGAASFTPTEVENVNGVDYVRTQLELELASGATAAELQALLAKLNAQIVSSVKGIPIITVRIPDPGSLAALEALVAQLAGEPALVSADIQTVPVTTQLPDIIDVSDVSSVRPQLGSHAHGAWNARNALTGRTPPGLLIGDFFGAGPPGPEVAVQEVAADFVTTNPLAHGYTILGLAAGRFEPGAVASLAADQVTGMWPGGDIPLRVVDLRLRIAGSTLHDRLILLAQGMSGNVVINTSVEDGCARTRCTDIEIDRDARQWVRRVRLGGLENRLLHVSAAGNIYANLQSDTNAAMGAAVNAAALKPLTAGVPNLTNTLVVENTTASDPADGPVTPVCLTATSKRGGQISAVGNDIHSFSAPGVHRLLAAGGTSSAAPQVAGAAAMVWALSPARSAAEVIERLTRTGRPVPTDGTDPRCTTVQAAPALDFHAAVLAVDSAVTAPARAAILDVADANGAADPGNAKFDEKDLEVFRDEYEAIGASGQVPLDYGRYDLNGDGYTGGGGRARIDLDSVTNVDWTFSQRREVLGLELLHNENDARDIDVLCHEANGPLYAGDTAARDVFNEQYCLPPVEIVVDPTFPSTLQPGAATNLRILARRTDLTDATVKQQPGVRLEYTVTGGNVGAVTGLTGQDGAFSTTATLVSPADEVEIEVVARAGQGGPELDRLTVVATRPASGQVSITSVSSSFTALADACIVECGSDDDRGSSTAFGPFSGSGSASMSRTGSGFYDGNSASASADASQSSQIQAFAADPEIVASGSASGSAQRTFGANAAAHAAYSGQAGAGMRFRVLSGSVPWSAQGTLNGVGSIFYIFRHGGGGQFVARVQNQNVALSGALPPGDYEMASGASCSDDKPSSCTSSYSITFDIDP